MNNNEATVTITRTIAPEFIDDVITTACEGGINYWANSLSRTLNHIRIVESEDARTHNLTVRTLVNAMHVIINGMVRINSATRAEITEGVFNNDAGMIDAQGADAIVQVAVFGELVYG